jgi:hypothetical protein
VIGATDGVMDEKPMMFKSFLQVSSDILILTNIIIFYVSMWWDYVSELRPPMDLFFPQMMIYEYGALVE